jgi:hypothetical protein
VSICTANCGADCEPVGFTDLYSHHRFPIGLTKCSTDRNPDGVAHLCTKCCTVRDADRSTNCEPNRGAYMGTHCRTVCDTNRGTERDSYSSADQCADSVPNSAANHGADREPVRYTDLRTHYRCPICVA